MQLEFTKSNRTHGAIQQVQRQLSNLLRRQAEEIQRLVQSLRPLQNEQCQLEAPASRVLEPLVRLSKPPWEAGTLKTPLNNQRETTHRWRLGKPF